MKLPPITYTFNAAAKTIAFTGYTSINLASILLITNTTSNIVIYNFADPTKGGTVATNILTLTYNTTAMSNGDALNIVYDDPAFTPSTREDSRDLYIAGQGSQTTLGNNVILATAGSGSFDTMPSSSASYRSACFHFVPATGTVTAGQITFEGSNDNFVSTANPILLYDLFSQNTNPASAFTISTATTRYFGGNVSYRYIRARISVGITGTTTGIQCFSRFNITPFIPTVTTIAQATAANLQTTATATIKNAPTSTISNVASSATSVTLIASNTSRKTLIIYNDSTATLYVTLNASVASTSNFSHVLLPITGGVGGSVTIKGDDYSGEVRGIWSSANGFARITEVV